MKILKHIIISITVLGCISDQSRTLESNSDIANLFSQSEIRNLNKILSFFESNICPEAKVKECYEQFFVNMASNEETGEFILNIDFEDQKRFYETLNDSPFDEIWSFGWTIPYGRQLDSMKYITINQNGIYFKFLDKLSEDSENIKKYREALVNAGDISPSASMDVLMNYKQYDIRDIRIRLFIAIHYLTLNDQYKRVEKFNQ